MHNNNTYYGVELTYPLSYISSALAAEVPEHTDVGDARFTSTATNTTDLYLDIQRFTIELHIMLHQDSEVSCGWRELTLVELQALPPVTVVRCVPIVDLIITQVLDQAVELGEAIDTCMKSTQVYLGVPPERRPSEALYNVQRVLSGRVKDLLRHCARFLPEATMVDESVESRRQELEDRTPLDELVQVIQQATQIVNTWHQQS